ASVDLPACRATNSSTVRNRYVPSSRISSAPFRNSFCHGNSVTFKTSWANSIHSKPSVVFGVNSRSGGVKMRGRGLPLSCTLPTLTHIGQLALSLRLVQRGVHTRLRGQEQGVQHRLPMWPRVGNLPSRISRRLLRHLFDLLRHHPEIGRAHV